MHVSCRLFAVTMLALAFPMLKACAAAESAPSRSIITVAPGSDVPSFMPWNVTGQHAGKASCPLCVYGEIPGAAIWTRIAGLPQATTIAAALDRTIDELAPRRAVGYVVLVPDAGQSRDVAAAASLREAFADTPLRHVFVTIADVSGNREDLDKYRLNPAAAALTTTIIYIDRAAVESHDDMGASEERLALLRPAMHRLFDEKPSVAAAAVAMCENDEPGDRLELHGRILDEHGQPLAKASVIAYSTDSTGLYVPRGSAGRSPRISGVAITDADGRYRFRTIMPGPYPDSMDPAHIHMHIDAAVHAHMYRTLWFEGDPRLTPAKRQRIDAETVIETPRRDADGTWIVQHDVRLEGS